MSAIVFTVPGPPRGKGRGTPVKRGPHMAIVSGPETEAYQNKVAMAAAAAMRAAGLATPIEGPLEVRLLIRMAIPGSASRPQKDRMRRGELKPTKKPDFSNVLKAIEDGMNGVVWRDDAQITFGWVRKVYADLPGVDVSVAPDTFAPGATA